MKKVSNKDINYKSIVDVARDFIGIPLRLHKSDLFFVIQGVDKGISATISSRSQKIIISKQVIEDFVEIRKRQKLLESEKWEIILLILFRLSSIAIAEDTEELVTSDEKK